MAQLELPLAPATPNWAGVKLERNPPRYVLQITHEDCFLLLAGLEADDLLGVESQALRAQLANVLEWFERQADLPMENVPK